MKRYDIDSTGVSRPAPDGHWVYYSTDVEPLEKENERLRAEILAARKVGRPPEAFWLK